MALEIERKLFTAAEFDRMAEAGILDEDTRVELIEGEIIAMNPIGVRHVACVNAVEDLLRELLGRTVFVSVQNPVVLGERLEPYPDVAVLRRRADRYRGGLPQVEGILLLIEVSDTTLRYDRETKLPLYARAGVPEVWIVDLVGERVLTYRDPAPNGMFGQARTYRADASVPLPDLPDLQVPVADILA